MTINTWKTICFGLAAVLCLAVIVLARSQSQLNTLRTEIRYATGVSRTFQNGRAAALSGGASEALQILQSLRGPVPLAPRDALEEMIERQRQNAIEDIIQHLRLKTGKDYGSDPDEWLKALRTGVPK